MSKSVGDIVEQYLRTNNYDGLYNPYGECGCLVDDLAPCGEMTEECLAGMKVPCPGGEDCPVGDGCEWHIGQRRKEASDE